MIVEISWQDFHMRFLKTSELVYVLECIDCWKFYSASGVIVVKSTVEKKEEKELNIAFVDRYLNNVNIIPITAAYENKIINIEMVPNVLHS